jgi:four helix bundle protein
MKAEATGKTTRSHRDLIVWQEAMKRVEMTYRESARFPKDEIFGLTSQLRRSAVSVPSNIAEGAGRNSTRELVQFVGVASGSLAELDTQLDLAVRLGFLDAKAEAIQQIARVGQLLVALRRSLQERVH